MLAELPYAEHFGLAVMGVAAIGLVSLGLVVVGVRWWQRRCP